MQFVRRSKQTAAYILIQRELPILLMLSKQRSKNELHNILFITDDNLMMNGNSCVLLTRSDKNISSTSYNLVEQTTWYVPTLKLPETTGKSFSQWYIPNGKTRQYIRSFLIFQLNYLAPLSSLID